MIDEHPKIPANTQRTYEITHNDLPLSCPTADMTLWNSHPRVFLPIAETGKETCPYCSAVFVLKGWEKHQP